MPQRITNVKLGHSRNKTDQAWNAVKAQKRRLLMDSDWTQLTDLVNLINHEDFAIWRKRLRNLNLKREFSSPEQAAEFLTEYEKIMPVVKQVSVKAPSHDKKDLDANIAEIVEREVEKRLATLSLADPIEDTLIDVEHRQAVSIAVELNSRLKVEKLLENGAAEYALIRERLDRATDFLVDQDTSLNEYTLLQNDTNMTDREYASEILEEAKQYFKNLLGIEQEFAKKRASIQNMGCEQLNEFFKTHGYRHRCTS